MVRIYYGSKDPFYGFAPTPLVGRGEESVRYNRHHGIAGSLELAGNVTGSCDGNFASLYAKAQNFVGGFSKNFQAITIIDDAPEGPATGCDISSILFENPDLTTVVEDSSIFSTGDWFAVFGVDGYENENGIYQVKTIDYVGDQVVFDYTGVSDNSGDEFKKAYAIKVKQSSLMAFSKPVIIRDISFEESRYVQITPFSISVDYFHTRNPTGEYFNALGVLDPVDEFSFREQEDQTVSLSHKISAKGIHTHGYANNAFSNAQEFVWARTGWSNQALPHFIDSPDSVIHVRVEETADRLGGTYGVTETYLYDPKGVAGSGASSILRYTCDYNKSDEESTVKIAGNFNAGKTGSLAAIKNDFANIDFFNIASGCYYNFDSGVLYDRKITASFEENPQKREINFDITYSDHPQNASEVSFTDKIAVTENEVEQTYCVSLNGRFEANSRRCGDVAWTGVQDAFAAFDAYSYVTGKLVEYGETGVVSSRIISHSYGEDPLNKTIDFNYSYCRDDLNLHRCFENLDYGLSFSPAIPKYSAKPVLDGTGRYIVQDLGYDNRVEYGLQGNARISDCCTYGEGIAAVKSWMNDISAELFVGNRKILESEQVSTGNAGSKIVGFSASWSAEADRVLPDELFS